MIQISNDMVFDDSEIEERFVRAFGARGQNAKKEATAVELRLHVPASLLPPEVKERLTTLAGRKITNEGVLVVVSRAFRSQADNRDAARARLVSLLQRAATEPTKRKATKPRRAVRAVRLASKRSHSAVKQSRRTLRPMRG